MELRTENEENSFQRNVRYKESMNYIFDLLEDFEYENSRQNFPSSFNYYPLYYRSRLGNSEVNPKKFTTLLLHLSEAGLATPELIQTLINTGLSIDFPNRAGQTPLHLTLRSTIRHLKSYIYSAKQLPYVKNFSPVEFLVKRGANRDTCDKIGRNPFHEALFSGVLEAVEALLKDEEKLPNIERANETERRQHVVKYLLNQRSRCVISTSNYSMLLHFLILQHDEDMFEHVAKKTNFDPNGVNHETSTLLKLTSKKGTPRMIKALIEKGADPDDYAGASKTPIFYAIEQRKPKNVQVLLDCGASTDLVEKQHKWEANTPLHFAACSGDLEIVEMLIKKGADVNAKTYYRSPLLLSCGCIDINKLHKKKLSSLLLFRFTIEERYHGPDFEKLVTLLLDQGADIDAQTITGRTALDHSCKHGNLELVKLLLSRGAALNKGVVSTLHQAVKGGSPDIVRLILKQGVDVNYRCPPEENLTETWRTPLQWAVSLKREGTVCKNLVDILLENGADVNLPDTLNMETPLHLACLSDCEHQYVSGQFHHKIKVIKSLLKAGANVNALDIKGKTPLNYAIFNCKLVARSISLFHSQNNYILDVRILTAAVAKIIKAKQFVIVYNFMSLEDKGVRPIYEQCVIEIDLMKKNIIESVNFSYFDILTKDVDKLGGYLQNEDIQEVLESFEFRKKFPSYADEIEERIWEITQHQRLIEVCFRLFNKHLKVDFPLELALENFKYLSQKDLKNFVEACFASNLL